jgi:glycine cleavage system H protein
MSQNGIYYTREHEWVRVSDEDVRMGISDHAQAELGDIVFVELPEVDDTFEQGDELGSVESVKAVSELFSPLDIRVVEINEDLEETPDLVNKSAEDGGWMIKIELEDASQLEALMNQEQYAQFVKEESN